MNETQRRYLISSLVTFLTTAIVTIGLMLEQGPVEWTGAFLFSVLMVAARAGVKAVVQKLITGA